MPKLVVTPWKWHNELLEIRAWFYRSPDLRREACALTTVWKRRGRLPHAVESTALITDAILHDEALSGNDVSELSLRGTYAMALNKFVTRLADKYQNKDQGKRQSRGRSSMYNSAKALDLPDAFVEIRHQITHGDLPSLVVLRNYAKRALSWLWQHYWSSINVHNTSLLLPSLESHERGLLVEKSLRAALREYRDLSIEAIGRDRKKVKELRSNLPVETSLKVFQICRADLGALEKLRGLLLRPNYLFPSLINTESMQGAFDIWDALLKNISLHDRDFLPLLVRDLLSILGAPSMLDVRKDVTREAIYEWIMHLLVSEEWRQSRTARAIIDSTVRTCIMTQNYWTRQLLINAIIKSEDIATKSQYGRLAKQAIESCTGTRAALAGELPDDFLEEGKQDEEEGSGDEQVYDPADDVPLEDLVCLESQGWRLADNWAPTPFGNQPAFPLFSD